MSGENQTSEDTDSLVRLLANYWGLEHVRQAAQHPSTLRELLSETINRFERERETVRTALVELESSESAHDA